MKERIKIASHSGEKNKSLKNCPSERYKFILLKKLISSIFLNRKNFLLIQKRKLAAVTNAPPKNFYLFFYLKTVFIVKNWLRLIYSVFWKHFVTFCIFETSIKFSILYTLYDTCISRKIFSSQQTH